MFSRKDTHIQPTKSFTLSHFLADPKPLAGGINDYTYVTFNSSHTPSYHFFGAETVGMANMSGHSGCFCENTPCYRLTFCPPEVHGV